jgi:hypothetical protein
MALLFYYPNFEYLLCIRHFDNVSIGCDIVFEKGQIHFAGFVFLTLLGHYGILGEKL